jgi:hypothetical protein
MWRVFDYLPYVNGKRLSIVVTIALLLWIRYDPRGFIAATSEWGKHNLAPATHLLQHAATTTTTSPR